MKAGIKTTEFWATVFNAVGMFAVAFGLLSQEEVDEIIALALALIGAVVPIIVYIQGRIKLKS